MSEYPEIYVHIGLPKAASTKFQREIFPFIKGMDYPQGRGDTVFSDFVQLLQEAGGGLGVDVGLERGAISEKAISEFKKRFDEELVGKKTPVIYSDEYFVNPLAFRNIDGMRYALELLKCILPNCKIMIFLRRQDSYSKSQYGNFLKKAGFVSPEEFLENLDDRFFDYEQIYKESKNVVGADNLFILPYELYFKDSLRAYESLSKFLGVEMAAIPRFSESSVNATPSSLSIRGVAAIKKTFKTFSFLRRVPGSRRLARKIFLKVRKGLLFLDPFFMKLKITQKFEADDKVFLELFNRSVLSNVRLAQITDIDLSSVKYH